MSFYIKVFCVLVFKKSLIRLYIILWFLQPHLAVCAMAWYQCQWPIFENFDVNSAVASAEFFHLHHSQQVYRVLNQTGGNITPVFPMCWRSLLHVERITVTLAVSQMMYAHYVRTLVYEMYKIITTSEYDNPPPPPHSKKAATVEF